MTERTGRRAATVTLEVMRTGQPRPYADHEDVYRVHFEAYNWEGENPKPGRYSTWTDLEKERAEREQVALAMCGAADAPRGYPCVPVVGSAPFTGRWVEKVEWLDEGTVEIMLKATFFD